MLKKPELFFNWLIKEGLALVIFSAIMLVIVYALINVFTNPNI
jgi:hypothetical protein